MEKNVIGKYYIDVFRNHLCLKFHLIMNVVRSFQGNLVLNYKTLMGGL